METVAKLGNAVQIKNHTKRILIRITFIFLLVSMVIYFGISAVAAYILTVPKRNIGNETPANFNLPFSDVTFFSRKDNIKISAWFIPNQTSHKVIILVHGKDSSRSKEFQDDFVGFASSLFKKGFTILMIDLRGHGKSGDGRLSFGINEKNDINGAVDWLKENGFKPESIGVLGVSLGAGSSIFALADNPEISAVVADCGFAEIYPIIEREWTKESGLPQFFLPSTVFTGKILLGYDISLAKPVDQIALISSKPVLIIHGSSDSLVPITLINLSLHILMLNCGRLKVRNTHNHIV
jgi:dipeptidyl aminopeptidase/acylaminoacyl peptidase